MRAFNRLTRRRHWRGKLADLALFAGFALAVQTRPTSQLFFTGCLFLSASAALAVFGYAWNDACDVEADREAGKDRPPRSQSRSTAFVALAFAAVCFAGASRLDAVLLALALAAVLLAWAYSGGPLRLKERRALGLLAGAIAQRTLPAVFVAVAFDLSVRHAVPWLVWMTCWGLRGMVVHQVQDAEGDRRTGLATWGARKQVPKESHRLIAVLLPVEAASLAVGLLPLLAPMSVRIGATAMLAAWTLFMAAALSHLHARSIRLDWLSFRYMPLEELYSVFAPVLVAVALVRSGGWVAPAWIALDATLRASALWRSWGRVTGVTAFWFAARGERLAEARRMS